MALMLFQNAIYIPGKISYTTETSWYVGSFDLGVDLMFFMDVWLTFFFALKIRGYTHTKRSFLAKHYICGNFWLDLFLALPWQLGSEVAGYPLKIFRLVRVNKRFGQVNLFQFLHRLKIIGKKEAPSNITLKILQIAASVFYFTHFMGCLWFYVAKVTGYPSDCWVVGMDFLDSSPQM